MSSPARATSRAVLSLIFVCAAAHAAPSEIPLETNAPEIVTTYEIINKVSGFHVLPEWSGARPDRRGLHHWPRDDRSVSHPDGFQWVFLPVPGKHKTYWIINKQSGFGLLPPYAGTRPGERGMHHWPIDDQSLQNPEGSQWRVEDAGEGYVHIVNVVSNHGLLPEWSGTRPGNRGMHHWPFEDRNVKRDGFKWRLKKISQRTLPALPKATWRDVQPTLQGHGVPREPVDVGVVGVYWIPCAQVNDPGKSISWKLDHSPYYRVERSARWIARPETAFHNASDTPVKKTWTTTSGWAKSKQTSFETTIGFSLSGGSALLGASFESSFSFTTGSSTSDTRSGQKQDATEVSIPPKTTMAMWQRVDTLRVKRMDGSTFTSEKWDVPGTIKAMTQFPPAAPAAAPAAPSRPAAIERMDDAPMDDAPMGDIGGGEIEDGEEEVEDGEEEVERVDANGQTPLDAAEEMDEALEELEGEDE